MAKRKSTRPGDPVTGVPPAVFSFMVELSRLLIAGGISANALKELALRAHVQAACEVTQKVGRKPNKALIAAMTGLSRVEVTRLLAVSVDQRHQPLPSASHPARGCAAMPSSRALVVSPWPCLCAATACPSRCWCVATAVT